MLSSLIKFNLKNNTAYKGHWPIGKFENLFMIAGSAVVSLVDVYRHGKK